jgi:hypothetical protein
MLMQLKNQNGLPLLQQKHYQKHLDKAGLSVNDVDFLNLTKLLQLLV